MIKKNTPVFTIRQHCDSNELSNFKVASFNEVSCTAAEFEENHRHEYFEIIWLKNGAGIHHIDMIDHHYNGSVLFFLAPGQVHKITEHKKSQGYVLKFLPAVFKQERDFLDYVFDTCLFDTVKSCSVIGIPKQMDDIIGELFFRFREEFNKQQPDADIILSSYLKILTTLIRRIKNTYLSEDRSINNPQYDLFRKFKIAVEHHYKTKHTVQDYAIHLKTQARTLNTVARKYSNKSALEFIQDRIILEAKRRLYHDNESIKELCYQLGFEDPAYFTRFFKKNVGIAPQHFKTDKSEMLKAAIA
jgi:AraC family transcriptional regulator, transcriptional activator of pobA